MKLLFENWRGYLEEKEFPDLTGDGKVTRADILQGRGVDLDENEYLDENDYLIEEDYIDEQGGSPRHKGGYFPSVHKRPPSVGSQLQDYSDGTAAYAQDATSYDPSAGLSTEPVLGGQSMDPASVYGSPESMYGYSDPGLASTDMDGTAGGFGTDVSSYNPVAAYANQQDADRAAAANLVDPLTPQNRGPSAEDVAAANQSELDQLKGFGSKFRKARELGMTKFKHKGKTFGTRMAKRSRPGPADGLPTTKDPRTLRDIAAMTRQAGRRVAADDVRARERAISDQLGPGGVMGVAQDAKRRALARRGAGTRPPMNENRRPSKRLKMKVKRLNKTTE